MGCLAEERGVAALRSASAEEFLRGWKEELALMVQCYVAQFCSLLVSPKEMQAGAGGCAAGLLLKLWPHSAPHPALRREMAGRILSVAQGITTAPDEAVTTLLKQLSAELKADVVVDSQEASAKASAAVQGALAGKSKLSK